MTAQAIDSYSYIEPKGAFAAGPTSKAPVLWARPGDGAGSASSSPPPPPGAGSHDDGGGSRKAGPGWSSIPSLNASDRDRLGAVKAMRGADEISASVMVDLTRIEGEANELKYLADVAETVDELLHSGNHLDRRELVGALHLIARAAEELTGSVTIERVGMSAGLAPARVLMKSLTRSADHLERMLLHAGSMDRETAAKLADIYLVTAVKGANCEAHMSRFTDGISSFAHRAHIGKTVLQLIDVAERYRLLGMDREMERVRGILTDAACRHGFPGSMQKARDAVMDYLRRKIEFIYARVSVDPKLSEREIDRRVRAARVEREADFLRSLRYAIDGNRKFAALILLMCQDVFRNMGDREMWKRMNRWMKSETDLTHRHSRI